MTRHFSYSSDFQKRVAEVVSAIPRGSVMSYRDVARQAGYPRAARAVGTFLRKNNHIHIPCHRVIHSNGRVGAYNRGGEQKKCALLVAEGVLCDYRKNVFRTQRGGVCYTVAQRR